MGHLPRRRPDEEPLRSEDERFHPAEIDITRVIEQDYAIGDVIYDALSEVEADGGVVPEWGARTLARALANERDDPTAALCTTTPSPAASTGNP